MAARGSFAVVTSVSVLLTLTLVGAPVWTLVASGAGLFAALAVLAVGKWRDANARIDAALADLHDRHVDRDGCE